MKKISLFLSLTAFAALISCTGGGEESAGEAGTKAKVLIDGSSTVYPVSQAMAEEFLSINPGLEITVGVSGTGGGFKKFCADETHISNASRPIKQKEHDMAVENGIEYIEIPVAFDGLSVVVNKNNDWVDHLTVDELKRIFGNENQAKNWSDVRDGFPNRPISIYAPDTDSGTFDYFNEAVTGKGNHTSDYQPSADDNVLITGIAGDENSIGYFGYAYYIENTDKLKLVAIDNGNGPVLPTEDTINNGSYSPLSRPIFIYVSTAAAKLPKVSEFVNFYLDQAPTIVKEVGYVDLPKEAYDLARMRLTSNITGSVFNKEENRGKDLLEILRSN